MNAPNPPPQPFARVQSVDALRGFDMLWIAGADSFAYALEKMSATQGLADQLRHTEWAGFRFYDLIFPLFVFLVGVSIVFSLTKHLEQEGKWAAHKRVFRRFVLLFAIALLYSGGFSRTWPDIRLLGVLNRIALCYLFASLLFLHLRTRGLVVACAALLIGYWALMTFVPFPDVRPVDADGKVISQQLTVRDTAQLNWVSTNQLHGVFDPGVNLANYLDQKYLPGKKWDGTWDPEGLLSTLPAIATALLGVFAGLLLRSRALSEQRKVFWLLGTGVAGVSLGFLWGAQFPVIKKVWTSSYVLVAGGYSAILLAVFHQVIEIWQRRQWAQVFIWVGANAITIYLLNNLMSYERVATRFAGGDVRNWLDHHVTNGAGDLLIATIALVLAIAVARFLYVRKIFLRL